MQHLEGRGTPVLYIGRTVLNGKGLKQPLYHMLSVNVVEREWLNKLKKTNIKIQGPLGCDTDLRSDRWVRRLK
jgi:hypothetical protein